MLTVSKIIIAQSFEPSLRGLKDLIIRLPQIDTKQPDTEQQPDTHIESVEQLTAILNKHKKNIYFLIKQPAVPCWV